MKRLFLAVLFCCITSIAAFAEGNLELFFDGDLNCEITDTVKNDGWGTKPPITLPPGITTLSNINLDGVTGQLTVYNGEGGLVYTSAEPILPNSTIVINTDGWTAGRYTFVITIPGGVTKQFIFEYK